MPDDGSDSTSHAWHEAPHAPSGYRLQSEDTSYAVEQVLLERWRAMTTAERAQLLTDGFRALERLSAAGVRLRHPAAEEREVWLRTAALRLGRDLMIDVYNWDPHVHGA